MKCSLKKLLLVVVLSAVPLPLYAQTAPAAQIASLADLVEKLSPAVVNISTTQKVKSNSKMLQVPNLPDSPEFEPFHKFFDQFGGMNGMGGEREVTSLGSGFIIDAAGYIITNNHVIDEADEITVRLSDDSKLKAKIVGRDKKTDLALLKVESAKPLPFVTMGDSDAVRVGDWVIAIGNPYGLGGSVTQGIISARQRSINAGPFDDFLQTDAPINRGNSGGPLFNMKGEVIGINSAIFSPSGGNIGIGFAIPTSLAQPVISQLKEFGRTHRGWLGVKIQEVTEEIAESTGMPSKMGALVLDATAGSPAQKAGIQTGDIITRFDGKEVKEMRFLPRLVAETKIGKSVPVTLWRKGKEVQLSVTLGEMEEETKEAASGKEAPAAKESKMANTKPLLSMQLSSLTPQLRERFGIAEDASGVLVADVEEKSEALKRGIQPGDVIAEVSGEAVQTPDEAIAAFEKVRKAGRKFVLLKVLRDKSPAFVTLPVADETKGK